MQILTASLAEYAVLLSAMQLDSVPFTTGSSLLDMDSAQLAMHLLGARERLLRKGWASEVKGGQLQVDNPVRELMSNVYACDRVLDVHHLGPYNQPLRARAFIGSNCAFLLHWMGALPIGNNSQNEYASLSVLTGLEALSGWIMLATSYADGSATTGDMLERLAVPQDLFQAIAAGDAQPDVFDSSLQKAGFSAEDAQSFLNAGRHPKTQTFVTLMGLRGNRIRGGSIAWFTGSDVCWLVSSFDDHNRVIVQKANATALHDALVTFAAS